MSLRRLVASIALALLAACGQPTAPRAPAPASAPTLPPAPAPASASASGAEPRNPKAGDLAAIKAGQELFTGMNCDGCHGSDGTGFVAPSLADGRWRYGGSDAEVFASIYYGRPKGMPAFGGKLGTDGVWSLVTYLQSLPVTPDSATEFWDSR